MASLPPNSTARVKIFYEVCGHTHSAQIRYAAPNTVADVITEFNSLVTAIGAAFYDSSFIGAQDAGLLSDVFNDVAGDWPVGWGSGAGQPSDTANYCDFVGRSTDGKRVRFALFGLITPTSNGNYRTLTTESTAVDAAVQVLNDAEGTFLSINGFQPIWKSYVDIGINAYWRNKIR